MARAEKTPAPDDASAPAVMAEKIRTLFRQSPWILALNPVNAAIAGAVLWTPARGALIVAWVAATAFAAGLRAMLRASYFAARAPNERVWAQKYAWATGLQGVLWGAGSVVFYSSGDHASQLILAFVLGGMTAGAAGTLAPYLPSFFAYTVPAILPLAVRFFVEGGRLHVAMGGLGVLYGLALAMVAQNTNRAITEAFRLRFENDGLLSRLSSTQAALEEANRTLERRVDERSLALKRQDDALHEARRMESLGLLAGGIAHDFNNLLTVILGNAALIQDSPELARAPDGPLPEISKAAERAAALVSQLLATSRRQARAPRVLDLNAVVSDAQRLLARLIGEHIELVVSLRPAPLPTFADPGQLEQVIVNLATNARDAMPAGGTLTIETGETFVSAGSVESACGLAAGPYAVLTVRDTGVGMDSETRRLAFHPFFTTKEVGHGTGLGLATVSGIVEQSGGRVFVDSEPGHGSSFRVFLPRTAAPVAKEEARIEATPARRAATVLLVEDEPMVRAVMARAFEGAGLTVLEAEDGERGLARARAHEGPIGLLVTDVVMAHMGGFELATRLAEERPGLRVLFISGYGRGVEERRLGPEEGVDFLQKPFTSNALVDHAARLLAAAAPTRGGATPLDVKGTGARRP